MDFNTGLNYLDLFIYIYIYIYICLFHIHIYNQLSLRQTPLGPLLSVRLREMSVL